MNVTLSTSLDEGLSKYAYQMKIAKASALKLALAEFLDNKGYLKHPTEN